MANNVLRLPICFVPLCSKTKANEDMEKKQAPCNRKTARITNMSGWMYDLPMTEEQKQEMEQATERMRQRYIAAGMRTSL